MKYILIIGATSDIASALAKVYAKHGYNLYLAARDLSVLDTLSKDISIRYNVEVNTMYLDILDTFSHASIVENLPHKPVGVICAVGYLGSQIDAEQDFNQSKLILDTNLIGVISVCNIIANDFAARGSGFLVVISSVAGDRGRQSNYLYGAAKAGLTTYLSGLRNRLHKAGVQVVTIKPGFVDTRMTRGIRLPKLLTVDSEKMAQTIFHGQQKGKDIIYSQWIWRYIMAAICLIPEAIFKKLSL